MKELVSVVVPCYNQSSWLSECISSLLASSYRNIEVIVVDDGSLTPVDNSFADARVRILRQNNQGICWARDNGIEQAKGDLILVVDADDMVSPDFIERAVCVFRDCADVVQVGGSYALYQDGQASDSVQDFRSGLISDVIMAYTYIHSACMFRKSAWKSVSGYSKDLNRLAMEDTDFTMKLHASGGKAYFLSGVTSYYRQHGESRNNHQLKRYRAKIRIAWRFRKWYVRHPRYLLSFLCWNLFGALLSGIPRTDVVKGQLKTCE